MKKLRMIYNPDQKVYKKFFKDLFLDNLNEDNICEVILTDKDDYDFVQKNSNLLRWIRQKKPHNISEMSKKMSIDYSKLNKQLNRLYHLEIIDFNNYYEKGILKKKPVFDFDEISMHEILIPENELKKAS